MDRWDDADDGIRNGMQRARVVTPDLNSFVKKASLEPSGGAFAAIEVVPSKKEQKRQHAAKVMPPPPVKPLSTPQVGSIPGLPPIPDLPAWVAGPVPDGYYVQVLKEGSVVQEINIEKTVTVFGRAQAVDVVMDHQSVSRMHAALCVKGSTGTFFVMDLGAVHGTFLSNRRLSKGMPQEIQPGHEMRFGASTRRYVLQRRAPLKRSMPVSAEDGNNKRVRFSGMDRTAKQPQAEPDSQGRFADLIEPPRIIPARPGDASTQRIAPMSTTPTNSSRILPDSARSDHLPSSLYDALPPTKR